MPIRVLDPATLEWVKVPDSVAHNLDPDLFEVTVGVAPDAPLDRYDNATFMVHGRVSKKVVGLRSEGSGDHAKLVLNVFV